MASNNHLFQYEVGLMEVKYEVQLTNIAEVSVQNLDKMVDDIQHYQFIVFLLYACHEVQRRIPATMQMYAQLVREKESKLL